MSVGSNIRNRRYELKMSQQELCDLMGYKTRSTIAKIESGENDVSHKKLVKFAEVLDTSVEMLVSGYSVGALEKNPEVSSKREKIITIILAGGKSGRNSQNIPSQFINVKDRPIIVYCMESYQKHPSVDEIYVVCLKGWENIVKDYAAQCGITKLKGIITGAGSGIASLKNAVDHIKNYYKDDDLIIIQESTRPMVSPEMISKLIKSANEKGSATICHSMNDYVQFDISGGKPRYVDRNKMIALQSPEAHRLSLINEVFRTAQKTGHVLTESCCTMLFYSLGYDINFVESSINNIKIVREEDTAAFSVLIKD